jgi:hypothetical protein
MMTGSNLAQHRPGDTSVFASGKNLVGVSHVKQMVRQQISLGSRWLGRANVHAAVHLQRITVHNFAIK